MTKNILSNMHNYIVTNHLGWQLPDTSAHDNEIEHMPYQDLRSVEDYRKYFGSKISLGSLRI